MRDGWVRATLEDICARITDGAHHSPRSVNEGKPMASVKDLTPFGVNLDTCRRISQQDYDKLVRQGCRPEAGDILIAKDGATALDTVCQVDGSPDFVLLSSVAILRPKPDRVTSVFLRYCLEAEPTRRYMKNAFTTGAAIPRVVLKDFKRVVVHIPPLPVQRKIAAILSAYDDRIENNRRRIEILEEMAQALYREWFVEFRFPGHEAVRMVDSPLGKIPEGWEITTLGEVCDITMGSSPKSQYYNENGDGLPFHQGVSSYGDLFPTHTRYCTKLMRLAEAGDILFSVRAPVGRMNVADRRLVIGRGLASIRSKTGYQMFCLYQLKDRFREEDSMGGGTIFKAVTKQDMNTIPFIWPSDGCRDAFENAVHPMFEQMANLTRRNALLRQTRDLLLPRLISGELDVSELYIDVGEEGA